MIVAYYVIINIIAFALYGYDKAQSKNGGWRVAEKVLLGISLLGGFVGSWLGMKYFHHKTLHKYFQVVVILSLIIHVLIWYNL